MHTLPAHCCPNDNFGPIASSLKLRRPHVESTVVYDVHFLVNFAITKMKPVSISTVEPVVSNGNNSLCNATTLMMNPTLSTSTTTGSTFRPGESSVYSFSMVLEEPPAPAARVLAGLWLAVLSL